MTDGLVLLLGGALLLLAVPAFQWQVTRANRRLCSRSFVARTIAVSALVLGTLAGLASVVTGVALLA